MLLKPILAAAGLTATATTNALLLPPDVSVDDIITLPISAEGDFDVNILGIVQAQNLKLDCPGCPVRVFPGWKEREGIAKIDTDIPSHLELDFSIESSDNIDRLMLNGYELYPKSDPFKNTLTAALLPEFGDKKIKRPHHFKGARPQSIQNLGFGLQTRVVPSADGDEALELVVVDLQIIEVGNAFVDGIPNVEIKLVKTPSGKLMIADLAPTASETAQGTPMDAQEECTTMFCKWLAMAKQQFGRFRSKHCGGRPAHASQESGHFAAHHLGHPSHAHHRHEFKHSWKHLLMNIATQILLPVAIGIMAGVTASILGMIIGTFVVCVWRTFVRRPSSTRRRQRGHSSKAAVNEAVAEEEKSGLMAHQDEPDVPPAYMEEGIIVNDDKKPEDGA